MSDGHRAVAARSSSCYLTASIHRVRNLVDDGELGQEPEVKATYWATFDPTGKPRNERSIEVVRSRAETFSTTYGRQFPPTVT